MENILCMRAALSGEAVRPEGLGYQGLTEQEKKQLPAVAGDVVKIYAHGKVVHQEGDADIQHAREYAYQKDLMERDARAAELAETHPEIFDRWAPGADAARVVRVSELTFDMDPEMLQAVGEAITAYCDRETGCLFAEVAVNPNAAAVLMVTQEVPEDRIEYFIRLAGVTDPDDIAAVRRRIHIVPMDQYVPDAMKQSKVDALTPAARKATRVVEGKQALQEAILAAEASITSEGDERPPVVLEPFNLGPAVQELVYGMGENVYVLGASSAEAALRLRGKSGSKKVFKRAGLGAEGVEDIRKFVDIDEGFVAVYKSGKHDYLVLKQEEGVSGDGNSNRLDVAAYMAERQANIERNGGRLHAREMEDWLKTQIDPVAEGVDVDTFYTKLLRDGGIVEGWARLPEQKEGWEVVVEEVSGQYIISPNGNVNVVTTHSQLLGGAGGQVYLGATYPMPELCRDQVTEATQKLGQKMYEEGMRGRGAFDFVVTYRKKEDPQTGEVEIEAFDMIAVDSNPRKGGTTAIAEVARLYAGAELNEEGLLANEEGLVHYLGSDNLGKEDESYEEGGESTVLPFSLKGVTEEQFRSVLVDSGLLFDQVTKRGVVPHMQEALRSGYGKVGVTCIEYSPEAVKALYAQLETALTERFPNAAVQKESAVTVAA